MRLKSAFMCVALVFSMSVSVYANTTVLLTDFTAIADVELSGNAEYKAIRLTPEIYAATKENLADILLYSGEETVPYFINSSKFVSDTSRTVYEMALSDSFVKDGFRYFDYALPSPPKNDIRATSIHTSTTDEFVSYIELFGSHDGLVWDKVAEEKLYNVSGNQQLAIPFYAEQKYTHYRFKIPAAQDKLTFQEVWLEYNAETVTQIDFIDTINPKFSVQEEDRTTVISLEGIKHLPIASIEMDTNDMFKREVSVAGSRQVLYNLRFADEEYKNLFIPLSGYKSRSDTLEVRISNGDDSPIKIDSITVRYLADELIFKNPGSSGIRLYFGNEQMNYPLEFDIRNYSEYIIAQGYDTLRIGKTERLSLEPGPTDEFDYGLILNITITLVAVVLAFLIIRKLRKVRP